MSAKILKSLLCCLIFWLILPSFSFAQIKNEAKKVSFITEKSVRMEGKLLSKRGDTIMVETRKNGILLFDVKKLLQISYYDEEGYEIGSTSRKKPLSGSKQMGVTDIEVAKPQTDTVPSEKAKNPEVIVEIRDGGTLKGKLLSRQNDSISIDIGAGKTLSLAIKDIKSISSAEDKNSSGKSYYGSSYIATDYDAPYKNPAAARGVLTPNGMPLEKGDSYYQTLYGLLFHNFGFHVTDNFNLAVGTLTVPIFGYINPNVSFKVVDNLYLGAGTVLWFSPDGVAFQGFGSVAVGNRDHNIGLRLGQTFMADDEDFGLFQKGLTYSIAGQTRILNNWSFAAEMLAMSPKSEFNIATVGMRFTRPRITLDFGLGGFGQLEKSVTCPDCGNDFFFGIPYVAFAVKIGKKRR